MTVQMGAPPSEEQMADLLSNPAMAQTMNEALNNPAFVDYMIQQNPMLRNVPNAREMITSPYFRNLMTNPEAIRAAARMRSMFGGGQGPNPFPAPGATDTTPADAPAAGGEGGNGGGAPQQNPFAAMFGAPGAAGAGGMGMGMGGANPFMALFNPPAAGDAAPTTGSGASPQAGGSPNPAANPFAGLLGGAGMPQPNPDMMRQMMELFGGPSGGFGGAPAPPPGQPAPRGALRGAAAPAERHGFLRLRPQRGGAATERRQRAGCHRASPERLRNMGTLEQVLGLRDLSRSDWLAMDYDKHGMEGP